MHFIPDEDDPYGIVSGLVDKLPEGSYLVVSHASNDFLAPQEVAEIVSGQWGPFFARSEAEFARFVEGLELVTPGSPRSPGGGPNRSPSPGRQPPMRTRTVRPLG